VRPRTIVLAVMMTVWAGVSDAQERPAAHDVRVRSWISRTAVWVGDPVEFVVEFVCPPQVDVIRDDVAKDKLKLEGFEIVGTAVEREDSPENLTQRFRYRLATYETGSPLLRIAGWPVRYYVRRTGERVEDVSPAGEVQVPGATVARRSTLPDELSTLDLRTAGTFADVPAVLRLARPIGTSLVVLAAAPLAIWIAALVGRRRGRVSRPGARAVRAQARSALEEVRAIDTRSDAGRREAYGRLDRAVRQHLADTRGIPAHALSAGEVAARLQAAGSPHADAAGELLAECERARYGPPDRLPPAEHFGAALDSAERMLAGSA
jgi:hypothetical protein